MEVHIGLLFFFERASTFPWIHGLWRLKLPLTFQICGLFPTGRTVAQILGCCYVGGCG